MYANRVASGLTALNMGMHACGACSVRVPYGGSIQLTVEKDAQFVMAWADDWIPPHGPMED